ncbi:LysM peptidoglycan-binding domain-containing protein [Streptomyces sp. NBC_01571]|uniref:LysM peptidoglycan-binding domain-containing protein n=1 Tax=Streptomyces sp. NBC_01571 TaxID=2975883 RepID=UPI0022582B51|nr:transglycosylase family protein [Streptomyces sp. NBC_01571]MCX4575462.1 LysM peptidoglycan-binding domain-containing protein [Streptomyces sp. NBC_01571]
MLSGNGRHRRPRQAPALIVAAGVTGSAIAIPLLGAASANAADGTTWDRVAECESGGQWSADNGNGYYGGLQLTQENWQRYGGRMYAPSADEASRSQQIAVAEKVLADQGLAAWPTCGPLSGLSKNSGEVSVDTGVAGDSSSSSDSSTSSDGSDSLSDSLGIGASPSDSSRSDSSSTDSSSDETGNRTKSDAPSDEESGSAREADSEGARSTKGGESGNSGQGGDASAASEGATTGAGRHRGGSAAENSTDDTADGRGDDSSGRHASRDSGVARGVVDGSYVVRTGDSLSTIADALDLEGGWGGLYAGNEKTVGDDPDLILPGQSLAVDAESGEK